MLCRWSSLPDAKGFNAAVFADRRRRCGRWSAARRIQSRGGMPGFRRAMFRASTSRHVSISIKKRRIDLGRPLLDLLRGHEPFQRSAANRFGRKQVEKFVPPVEILRVIEKMIRAAAALSFFSGDAAIVDGELSKSVRMLTGSLATRHSGGVIGRTGGVANIDRTVSWPRRRDCGCRYPPGSSSPGPSFVRRCGSRLRE